MTDRAKDTNVLRDEDILAAALSEPNLFGVLVERYQKPFLRKARSILFIQQEAEDVVQETFTKIYLNAQRFREVPGATFSSWAYRILINTALSRYRKLKRHRETHAFLPTDQYEGLSDEAALQTQEAAVFSDYVSSILTRLPKHLSRVLTLRFLDGLTHREIAQAEGVSEGAVKTRVYRAKREFKRVVESL